jgi:hypothetical protein
MVTVKSIDQVRAFSSRELATQSNARQMLEGLGGRPKELTVQLAKTLDQLKRYEDEIKEKRESSA